MSESDRARQDHRLAFVLHSYPFRESSLIVETFTREFGRLGLVARGARRPKSALRGVLLSFQPLRLSWSGRSELRTLVRAEWVGGLVQPQGTALMCGFYLNELLLKLLHRDDPHEALFDQYQQTLHALAGGQAPETVLRRFEKQLLKELGYALTLDHEVDDGRPIEPHARYAYIIERGPVRLAEGEAVGNRVELSGQTLIDMAADDFSAANTLGQGKLLMRALINHYLGDKPLHTRQLLKDLQQLW